MREEPVDDAEPVDDGEQGIEVFLTANPDPHRRLSAGTTVLADDPTVDERRADQFRQLNPGGGGVHALFASWRISRRFSSHRGLTARMFNSAGSVR